MRVLRILHALWLLLSALLTGVFRYPSWPPWRQRRYLRGWSRRLLRALGLRLVVHGHLPEAQHHNLLVVANHISWLDIFVLHAVHPTRFVAKAELASWPVFGFLIRRSGTIFVERARRHDTARVNRVIIEALAGGDCIGVFPEGTTSDGRKVMRFHGSLLQPVIDAGGQVQPVALRYRQADGGYSDAAAYVGDTPFATTVRRIIEARGLVVEVRLQPLLAAAQANRRELAQAAREAIIAAWGPAAADSAPGTPPHPPGARH
ncbi:MAG: 1-acyl-sn-glycerol-3-phosphate acyltransferase [Betaproteobacteria bacterium]|nr:1-acyl-sn-glycerol-3-phosphate acyltransferase [Betaproteobacteria bacterium]